MYFFIFPGESVHGAMCPSHHPYVYYNGQYCCATNREKHYGPQGGRCDGSIISYGSLCCQNDNHYPCPGSNCQNYNGWILFIIFEFQEPS